MKNLNKILALVIIATFLASIPMVLADNKPHLIKVVFDLTADAKPPDHPGGGSSPSGSKGSGASGYSLMGVSWQSMPITIEIDPSSAEFTGFTSAVAAGVSAWTSEAKLTCTVEVAGSALSIDTSSADGVNGVMFGAIGKTNVIAQTTIWYNPSTGEIVDFDIVFNTYYSWGDATKNNNLMDIQNIATHELGHGFGLNDLYQPKWSAETMYGYASEGQTDKRTLDTGDIAGIQAIYGQ
jgi:hypothetical protein